MGLPPACGSRPTVVSRGLLNTSVKGRCDPNGVSPEGTGAVREGWPGLGGPPAAVLGVNSKLKIEQLLI